MPRRAGFAQSDPARPVPFVPVNRMAAIALGGLLGSLARLAVAVVIGPWDPPGWPTATLLVNLSGALAIGVIATSRRVSTGPDWLRPFLITGVLGGYTTFSAMALEAGLLLDAGDVLLAGTYVGLTMVFGLLAVRLGILLARRVP